MSLIMTTIDEEPDWAERQARRIGRQVRSLREQAGLSATVVASIATNLGYPMQRTALANLEAGRRKTISLAEISVFATILGTSPLALLFPLDSALGDDSCEYFPGWHGRGLQAWGWFTGAKPINGPAGVDDSDARLNWQIFERAQRLEQLMRAWIEGSGERRQTVVAGVDVEASRQSYLEEILAAIVGELSEFEKLGYPSPEIPQSLRGAIDARSCGA